MIFFFPLQFVNGVPQRGAVAVVHYVTGKVGDGFQPEHGSLRRSHQNGHVVLTDLTKLGGTGDGVIFQVDVATQRYNTFYQFRGNVNGRNPTVRSGTTPRADISTERPAAGGRFDDGTCFACGRVPFGSTAMRNAL